MNSQLESILKETLPKTRVYYTKQLLTHFIRFPIEFYILLNSTPKLKPVSQPPRRHGANDTLVKGYFCNENVAYKKEISAIFNNCREISSFKLKYLLLPGWTARVGRDFGKTYGLSCIMMDQATIFNVGGVRGVSGLNDGGGGGRGLRLSRDGASLKSTSLLRVSELILSTESINIYHFKLG